ncbi:hypothetical protein [Allorhizocola rhizosphaerae]|uniref:hypothetical protein n=1 Tax=Allorhizocola rhizosphaerae TaxID=1872709 RepID=UPI0013C36377|nr:hypothetical protein [Allorhizocola rhizosphaerae]
MRLHLPTKPADDAGIDAVRAEEEYATRVMVLCEMLAATDTRFHVEGFGSDDWRLDVSYNLSAVMEQLPVCRQLARNFGEAVGIAAPSLARLAPFDSWATGEYDWVGR